MEKGKKKEKKEERKKQRVWSAKPKVFSLWSFTDKFFQPLPQTLVAWSIRNKPLNDSGFCKC